MGLICLIAVSNINSIVDKNQYYKLIFKRMDSLLAFLDFCQMCQSATLSIVRLITNAFKMRQTTAYNVLIVYRIEHVNISTLNDKFPIPANNRTSSGRNVAREQVNNETTTTTTAEIHCHLPVSRMKYNSVIMV